MGNVHLLLVAYLKDIPNGYNINPTGRARPEYQVKSISMRQKYDPRSVVPTTDIQ